MGNRVEEAKAAAAERHGKGYNCCQAVACTFCEQFGVSEDMAFRLGEGFGFGMGDMGSTCGAVAGAIMVASMKNSQGTANTATKKDTYKMASEIRKMFEDKNGSSICRELKGVDTGNVLRSCPGCIADAVEIVDAYLLDKE